MLSLTLNASIQATLHNAHFEKPNGKPFTADMFLPGYKPAVQSWQAQKEIIGGIASMTQKVTPQQLAALSEGQAIFEQRAARAMKLRQEGAPAEKIRAVMDGVQ